MSEDKPGFLSRWSRRKLDAQQSLPLDEPAQSESVAPAPALPDAPSPPAVAASPATLADDLEHAQVRPLPTLDDVAALTADSDFSVFVRRGVSPEVKNAAMKKLFSDPHYNIMDGLDIYIDDYSKPEIMPQSMLRKMAGARILNLFTDEDEAKAVAEDARLAALSPTPASPGRSADDPTGDMIEPSTSAAPDDAPRDAPDDRPAGTMLESADKSELPAPREPVPVSTKPG